MPRYQVEMVVTGAVLVEVHAESAALAKGAAPAALAAVQENIAPFLYIKAAEVTAVQRQP